MPRCPDARCHREYFCVVQYRDRGGSGDWIFDIGDRFGSLATGSGFALGGPFRLLCSCLGGWGDDGAVVLGGSPGGGVLDYNRLQRDEDPTVVPLSGIVEQMLYSVKSELGSGESGPACSEDTDLHRSTKIGWGPICENLCQSVSPKESSWNSPMPDLELEGTRVGAASWTLLRRRRRSRGSGCVCEGDGVASSPSCLVLLNPMRYNGSRMGSYSRRCPAGKPRSHHKDKERNHARSSI
jgi:hypothetical protein